MSLLRWLQYSTDFNCQYLSITLYNTRNQSEFFHYKHCLIRRIVFSTVLLLGLASNGISFVALYSFWELFVLLFSEISNGYSRFKGRTTTRPEDNCTLADLISPLRLVARDITLAIFQQHLGISSFTKTMSPSEGDWADWILWHFDLDCFLSLRLSK